MPHHDGNCGQAGFQQSNGPRYPNSTGQQTQSFLPEIGSGADTGPAQTARHGPASEMPKIEEDHPGDPERNQPWKEVCNVAKRTLWKIGQGQGSVPGQRDGISDSAWGLAPWSKPQQGDRE